MGFNYTGSYQDAEVTRQRAAKGECYLAFRDESLVGTITVVPPHVPYSQSVHGAPGGDGGAPWGGMPGGGMPMPPMWFSPIC